MFRPLLLLLPILLGACTVTFTPSTSNQTSVQPNPHACGNAVATYHAVTLGQILGGTGLLPAVPVCLYASVTPGANVGSSATQIYHFIPPQALTAALETASTGVGSRFVLRVFGTSAANTTPKSVTIDTSIGPTPTSASIAVSGVKWEFTTELFYIDSSHGVYNNRTLFGTVGSPVIGNASGSLSDAWTALDFYVKLTGGADNDITALGFTVDFIPGNTG